MLDFIARHGLLASAKDRIPHLAAMDPPRAAALLVSQRDAVPPDVVAAKLADAAKTGERGARRILHLYLRALFAADPMSGEKAVLLGLGLGARAMTARRTGDLQRDVRLSEKALILLDAGLRLRPDLERPELREAIAALMRERG